MISKREKKQALKINAGQILEWGSVIAAGSSMAEGDAMLQLIAVSYEREMTHQYWRYCFHLRLFAMENIPPIVSHLYLTDYYQHAQEILVKSLLVLWKIKFPLKQQNWLNVAMVHTVHKILIWFPKSLQSKLTTSSFMAMMQIAFKMFPKNTFK